MILACCRVWKRRALVSVHASRWLATAVLFNGVGASFSQAQGTRRVAIELAIRVTDSASEAAIEQVRLELSHFPQGVVQMTFSDSSGRGQFNRVIPGAYIVRASKAGFGSAEVRVDVRGGEASLDVRIPMQRIKLDQTSTTGGIVSGRTLSIPKSALKEFQKGVTLLNEKQEPEKSAEYFRKAAAISPDYYEAYFMMGMAYLKLNSYDEAQKALEKSISLNSKFLEPYYPLAVVLIARKQYEAAERLLLQAMESDKIGWRWPFELARSQASQGRWDQALSYGRMAHDRPDAPSKVHLLLADLYSNTGNPGKAVEELEEFSKLDPSSPYMPRVQESLKELRRRM